MSSQRRIAGTCAAVCCNNSTGRQRVCHAACPALNGAVMRSFIVIAWALLITACGAASPETTTPAGVPLPNSDASSVATLAPRATAMPEGPVATPTLASTPAGISGTLRVSDGQWLTLSHPFFDWTLVIPRDWGISSDTGFELQVNRPDVRASVHLLAQRWRDTERLPDARAYVEYWKHYARGNLFPVFADGVQVSESETGQNQFGGPYLRFEFDDLKHGVRYMQVYASRGGPTSLVVTLQAKRDVYEREHDVFDHILASAALRKEQP